MTDNEMKDEGWDRDYWTDINPTCFVLDDGTIIYPSQDAEGNGPGMFFGKSQGEHITLFLSKKEA
jgi:hypothetical protein